MGYIAARNILDRRSITKPMSDIGASWGPSLPHSDSERQVLNNITQMGSQKTPYRQLVYPSKRKRRLLKTFSGTSDRTDDAVDKRRPSKLRIAQNSKDVVDMVESFSSSDGSYDDDNNEYSNVDFHLRPPYCAQSQNIRWNVERKIAC